MIEWIKFLLFLVVGIGMFGLGMFYRGKEEDGQAKKLYGSIAMVGVIVVICTVAFKFVFT